MSIRSYREWTPVIGRGAWVDPAATVIGRVTIGEDSSIWPGAVVMILIATLTAALVTNGGRSAWFVGVLLIMVYLVFAMTLYLLPPRTQ